MTQNPYRRIRENLLSYFCTGSYSGGWSATYCGSGGGITASGTSWGGGTASGSKSTSSVVNSNWFAWSEGTTGNRNSAENGWGENDCGSGSGDGDDSGEGSASGDGDSGSSTETTSDDEEYVETLPAAGFGGQSYYLGFVPGVDSTLGGTSSDANPVVSVTLSNEITVSCQYDSSTGRLQSVIYCLGAQIIYGVSYTYNAGGQRASATETRLLPGGNTETQVSTFTYDGYGRLAGVTISDGGGNVLSQYTYTYDAQGNRTDAGYAVNALNQYTSIPGVVNALTYDAHGNLTCDGTRVMTYDAQNRLVSVVDGSVKCEYQYDNTGRRTVKLTYDADGEGGWTLREMRTFTYDGSHLIGESVTDATHATPTLVRAYAWGVSSVGSAVLLSVTDCLATGGATTYVPLFDGNGNVMALTDSTGQVVATYTYDPYGKLLGATGPAAEVCPLRFGAMYYDDESGLYYDKLRYYSPALQRLISPDPAQAGTGVNQYSFRADDPVNGMPPSFGSGPSSGGASGSSGDPGPRGEAGAPPSRPRRPATQNNLTIYIFVDRATKPKNFNTENVEARLNTLLTPLKGGGSGRTVTFKLQERDTAPTPVEGLGWQHRYDEESETYSTVGEKEQYIGWVIFNNAFPSFARTQDAMTEINPARMAAKGVELGLNVNWDQAYANFLAHEQIYLGAYKAFMDNWFADNGTIESGHGLLVDAIDIPETFVVKFRRFLQLN